MSHKHLMAVAAFASCPTIVVATAASCSPNSSASLDDTAVVASGTGGLNIQFSPMYSAFDGVHDYKIPAIVVDVPDVSWSASDPSMVDLAPYADGGVLITTRRPGTVVIRAVAGNRAASSTLVIASGTPAQWETGNRRYNNGVALDASAPDADGGNVRSPACTNCHGSDAGVLDVQHTPEQTGGYPDEALVAIITEAQKPRGVPQRIMPLAMWQSIHRFPLTDEEKVGLILYLRSLTPMSQGVLDFGDTRMFRDAAADGRADGTMVSR